MSGWIETEGREGWFSHSNVQECTLYMVHVRTPSVRRETHILYMYCTCIFNVHVHVHVNTFHLPPESVLFNAPSFFGHSSHLCMKQHK